MSYETAEIQGKFKLEKKNQALKEKENKNSSIKMLIGEHKKKKKKKRRNKQQFFAQYL
jgi:hypothetical protein